MKPKRTLNIKNLQKAILDLHGYKARWVESVSVKETFKDETVWEGIVEVFDLKGHPTAKRAYAWSHSIDNSKKRKFYAVLSGEDRFTRKSGKGLYY